MNNTRDEDPAPEMELDHDKKVPRRFISSEIRVAVVDLLKTMVQHGHLPRGCLSKVGDTFGIHRRSVARIWRDSQVGTEVWVDGRVENTRPRMYPALDMKAALLAVDGNLRTSCRDCATQLGMSHTTFLRYTKGKNKIFCPSTLALKPTLTQRHRDNRLAFVNSKIAQCGLLYADQFDCIHVEEKWFYVDRIRKKIYLTIDEVAPIRDNRNKNFIEKVMFLAPVAQPQRQQIHVQQGDNDDSWVFFSG
jgi:hypothetical protein